MIRTSACPLRRWRVRNFKSIADADLELAPLTVLVGANSSGKSSLIQSILLCAQAASAPSEDGEVALNGSLVQLGELADVRRAGARRGDVVSVGCTVERSGRPGVGGGAIDWSLELAAAATGGAGGTARVRSVRLAAPTEVGGRVELESSRRQGRALELASGGGPVRSKMVRLAGTVRWSGPGADSGSFRAVGMTLRGGVPLALFVGADRTEAAVDRWIERLHQAFSDRRRPAAGTADDSAEPEAVGVLVEEAVDHLVSVMAAAVRASEGGSEAAGSEIACVFAAFDELRRDAARRGYWGALASRETASRIGRAVAADVGSGGAVARAAREDPVTAEGAQPLEAAGQALADLLANRVLHLGPLRQDPQVLYRSLPVDRRGLVGSKGEHAVALLHRHADLEVQCPVADGSVRPMALRSAVEHWLDALGLATAVTTADRAQLGLELGVAAPGGPSGLSLTAVGVGVSQVLPVLVMSLAAEPGSVLLLEQPELHLHPAVQQRLADFLLACAATGRQVIVETHSDHLVTRLRRRIAEAEGSGVLEKVALVLAERHDGTSRFRQLEANRYGGLDDWPEGFFDAGASDSRELLRAGLRKRDEET